jgi:phage terminase small subunit
MSGQSSAPERPLTPRMERFVSEYLVDLNATQAAIRAGYGAKSAERLSLRLMAMDSIRKRIREAEEARRERLGVTADRVVAELARMAFLDPADIASRPMTGPADIALLPERVRRAIAGWSWDRRGNFVLKLAPKERALELLGRRLGLFRDAVSLTGPEGGPIEVIRRVIVDPRDPDP